MNHSPLELSGLVLVCLAAACSPHTVNNNPAPPLDVPGAYRSSGGEATGPLPGRWWTTFNDEDLDRLVDATLSDNFDLAASWARLAQAEAMADSAGAPRWPRLDASLEVSRSHFNFPTPVGPQSQTQSGATGSLAAQYELDIWAKLSSGVKAAALDREAALDSVHALAMTLTAEVTEAWLDLVRARARLSLLEGQLETNQTFLELVKLRFAQGQSSAVDVNQQRQQVLASRAQLALSAAERQLLVHRLSVLVGKPPGLITGGERQQLPPLAILPGAGVPSELLKHRPDVRAARRRVEAADYRIGVAVADRYPSLRLSGRVGSEPNERNQWALNPVWSLAASLLQPIIDGGRRAAEVDRTRAVLAEMVSNYGQALLTAMLEVENALVQERQQRDHIEHVSAQVEVAAITLREARNRYGQGLSDFLSVLTALRSQQQTELNLLDAQRQLLSYRVQLCRALGGTWTVDLRPPAAREET